MTSWSHPISAEIRSSGVQSEMGGPGICAVIRAIGSGDSRGSHQAEEELAQTHLKIWCGEIPVIASRSIR
jgi:hypothetical protein